VMRGFYLVARPIVDLFNGMGNLVLKPFGIPPASEAGHAPHSEDELRELLLESRQGGLIESDEQQLSERALVFGDRRAREVMRSRSEIDYVTTADDLRTIAEMAVKTGRTRLPVTEPEGGLESAVGVINAKDVLRATVLGEDVPLQQLLRPLPRIPESSRLDEVLRQMLRERRHIALVVDEHGTVTGLVTLEDVIEELVGEIEDEFDPAEADLVRREGDRWVIDGSAPVRLVAERLGVDVAAPHEATISGHLLELLGRIPEEGEVVELGGVPLEVTRVEGTRIAELKG
jgi:CBS domain containing-hemolysin-like protein